MRLCLACERPFAADGWRCRACGFEPATLDGIPAFAPERAADDDAFRGEAFAELAALEEHHWWFQARSRLIVWALREHFPEAETMLDAGCGTGAVLEAIGGAAPGLRRSGGELLARGLERAAGRLGDGVALYQMDATQIPFEQEFDVVGAFDVIEHIDDDEAALRALRRALRPGGGLLLTVPQHPRLWTAGDAYGGHRRRYTRADLTRRLVRAGFDSVRITSFVSLLLPLMATSRVRARVPTTPSEALDELRRADRLGRPLAGVMALERRLTAAGVSFRWGGSLLVVARRAGNGR